MGTPDLTTPKRAAIVDAATPREAVVELLEGDWGERLFNPFADPEADALLDALRERWAEEQATVVVTSGAYDLLHLDHCAYLLDTKLQGAGCHYERFCQRVDDPDWDELPAEAQVALLAEFLRDEALRLVVSVDGNQKVAGRKSGRPEKGGDTRPVMDWETRARLITGLSVQVPGGRRQPIADAITANDPVLLAGTRNQDMFEQVASLRPEVWAAYHESEYIFEGAPDDERLAGVEIRRITSTNRFTDALIGNFSSTAVLNRLKG